MFSTYELRIKDQPNFLIAGLWSIWKDQQDLFAHDFYSFSMITNDANDLIRGKISHHRSVAILMPEQAKKWVVPEISTDDTDQLYSYYKKQGIFDPIASNQMQYTKVKDEL